jgi:triphosphatase
MASRSRHCAPASASGAGTAGGEAREIEWQLAAPDLDAVQRWLDRHTDVERLTIEPLPAQELHDTYLDTEDWRLFRAGFALRLRHKEGRVEATLKGLHSARADVADRREISEPLPEAGAKALAQATGPVGSRVRDVAGVKPLRTLFEVRNSRQRFAVRGRDRTMAVGEIALDEARFSRGEGKRRPLLLTRVELEAAGSDPAPLERLAQRLRTECGLHPATENKFAVGLRSASLQPPVATSNRAAGHEHEEAIDPATRADEFAARALGRLLDEWRAHEPVARLGETPEALHALRVIGRRMDTVLSLFDVHLPTGAAKGRRRLRSLLDALGAVRDVDIRLEAAVSFRRTLPQEDRQALDPLLRHLESERAAARAAMLRALDARRARHWLDSIPAQLERPALAAKTGSSRNTTALAALPDLLRGRYRRLRRSVRRLTPDSSLADYHEVRVRTKKLRYALEIIAPCCAEAADDMLAALRRLQNRLGTQHDAGAIAEYLTRLARQPPPGFGPQTLFTMGRMAELSARRAARLGGRIGKPWRKVSGRRWKALRSRIEALREDAAGGSRIHSNTSGD